MDIDITRLASLSHAESRSDGERAESPIKSQTALYGVLEGVGTLQREADERQRDIEQAKAVYREYQQNKATAGQLQTDILKGLETGEDIYRLFLKATEAISLMLSNTMFHSQAEAYIKTVYSEGLRYSAPLRLELEEVQDRLKRLESASQNDSRITAAITAHRGKMKELEAMIKETQL